MKSKTLFICTHNSARSQMAEGFMNALCGDEYEACSAGTKPRRISLYVIEVMTEIGVGISKQCSKSIEDFFRGKNFKYFVTVSRSPGNGRMVVRNHGRLVIYTHEQRPRMNRRRRRSAILSIFC
ncbi:MAG: hypothetical protein ACETWE_09150 [Candidatus Bathyarchaeia archaeon]